MPRTLLRVEKGDDLRLRGHILSHLATVGVDPDDVLHALDHKVHNNLTAAYYLLYNKLVRTLKDPPSTPSSTVAARRSQVETSDKSNGTPRRPELTADEIRTPTARREVVPVKSPGSATAITATASTDHQTKRRQSDSGASRPLSQASSSRPMIAASTAVTSDPQESHQSGILTAGRPSSVRSGRNLVFITSGGSTTVPSSSHPQRPQQPAIPPSIVRPPLQGRPAGHRASISNGMVALTPLVPQTQLVHRRPSPSTEAPPSSSSGSRRHTFIDVKASSPHALAAAMAAATASATSSSSTTCSSQMIPRKHRFSTIVQPSLAQALIPSVPHPPPPSNKEDDIRSAVDPRRIQPSRPPPQPRPPSSGHNSTSH